MNGDIEIELLSDTCFSAPASQSADVDTDVAHDSDGIPRVSGKTVRGLLRDTWLSAQSALDPGGVGEKLLGRGRAMDDGSAGALRFGDLRPDDETMTWLTWAVRRAANPVSKHALLDALTIERAMTSQCRTTDGPKTETLRVMRLLPAGTRLVGAVSSTRPLDSAEEQLLSALLGATRHVGLHRNRGAGHVSMTLRKRGADTGAGAATAFAAPSGAEVAFLPVSLTLTAPALMTGGQTDENSQVSLPYIPGAALRGCVAAAARGDEGLLKELVLGGVRYLNAYPEIDGKRSLPVPVTWTRVKDPRRADTDPAANARDDVGGDLGARADEQRAPVQTPFFAAGASAESVGTPATRRTTHQRRDRATGSTRDKSDATVFVYEALDAGQTFRSCIALPAADAARLSAEIGRLLTKQGIMLGRSGRAGYGGAPVVRVGGASGVQAATETGQTALAVEAGDRFVALLTSDALLRDPVTGCHDPARLAPEIAERFAGAATLVHCVQSSGRSAGINRLWRAGLPEAPTAGAGSAVVLEATRDLPADEIARLQGHPIGERTADGYGCFIVRAYAPGSLTLKAPSDSKVAAEPPAPAASTRERLRAAQRRLYRRALGDALTAMALQSAAETARDRIPSASLLHRLRGPLRAQASTPDGWKKSYTDWLRDPSPEPGRGGLRTAARRPLEGCSVDGRSLWTLLKQAAEPHWLPPVGHFAGALQANQRICGEADAQRIWDDVLRESAPLYLDALFSSLARRAREADDGSAKK